MMMMMMMQNKGFTIAVVDDVKGVSVVMTEDCRHNDVTVALHQSVKSQIEHRIHPTFTRSCKHTR